VVGVAHRRPDVVAALAVGHAALSTSREGERPAVSAAVYDLVTELVGSDAPAFLRHGVVQATSGAIDEELADRLIARVPQDRLVEFWELITVPSHYEAELARVQVPLLFARHDGCVMHTEEGFEDAAARFPGARVAVVKEAPCADPDFGEALREFCLSAW
jgi:hypothetical protein